MHNTLSHPSRSGPLCRDCRHLERDKDGIERRHCCHPSTPVSLTTGAATQRAAVLRRKFSPIEIKQLGFEPCGASGRLFEPFHGITHGIDQLVSQRSAYGFERAGLNVGPDKRRVDSGVPLPELIVDLRDRDFKPAVDRP